MTKSRLLRSSFAVLLLGLLSNASLAQRFYPNPRLKRGVTLAYQIEVTGSRFTQVESRMVTPLAPPTESLNAICLLQAHVDEATPSGFRLKTYLSDKSPVRTPLDPAPSKSSGAPDKLVEVSVTLTGAASQIKGLDQLSAPLRNAWTTWLNRFTTSMTFPKSGVRRGQRWQTSEPETALSPIAALSWERKYQYVKQDTCPSLDHAAKPDSCVVVFVRAQLKQKSSAKEATPPDYKLRGLTTAGTAAGANETVLYISAATGLLFRSTEDAEQIMDAAVGLKDGSNQVRYLIRAKSHSQIQLLPDVPQDIR